MLATVVETAVANVGLAKGVANSEDSEAAWD